MLYIHTSNQLEQLKKQYAELVKSPLKDVFKKETVVVQNAGMARWLSIEMAKNSGISANTEYLFPAEYMWRLLRLVTPDIPEHSQCAPDTLRFHIYQELLNHAEDYPELHHYILNNDPFDSNNNNTQSLELLSTWELSCLTARLLDQYLFYRSEWITEWEKHDSNHWQARIWNKCVKDKNLLHWLSLQEQFSKNIEGIDISILEERVCFFSMSALSPGYIDLLAGIAQKTDIHIFIINPCNDVYWGDIQSPKAHAKLDKIEQKYAEIGNPLLASLGKQGRDFIDKLISIQDQGISEYFNETNLNESNVNNTLLNQIQVDIYQLEPPKPILDFDDKDDSIQLHSCHTAMREVEVLYDQILAQLDFDQELAPNDIVVMMPDIEKYAPYIESVFGITISDDNAQKLPFSIADREPQNILKTVQALNKLFCLADSRFDVEAVLELLEYDDIRSHFDLNQDQFDYCRELALATNIRWGINAKSRQQDNLPNTEEHTWKYTLDRMLLGYALFEDDSNNAEQLFESDRNLQLLPFIEIEGTKALVLAKFKKFTDTVFSINAWQTKVFTLDTWLDKTIQILQQLTPENPDQQRIYKTIADIKIKADLADFDETLSYSVYHKILQQSLSEISTNEKYLGYGITFCALVPMRSVPFKIVALLGMNDGEFPRQDISLSFDLMAEKKRKGDRSRRDEDRYLFLESILAARKKLIISYTGQNIKDNTELPPSILVSELLDTIVISTEIEADDWIIKHPLQAFSSRYFQDNDNLKTKEALFSYASHYIQSNLHSNNKQTNIQKLEDNGFITKPLDTISDDYKKLSLNDLISFYKNPSGTFLKIRFGINSYYDDKELKIREPFEIESFKERDIRNLVLTEYTAESDKQLLARAKGLLPYGQIGNSLFLKEKHTVEVFEQQLPKLQHFNDKQINIKISDYEINAHIDQLTDIGRCITQVSRPFAGDYIDVWLTHLCLNASFNLSDENRLLAASQFYSPEASFMLEQVNDAEQQLATLLEYYWKGLHFPLQFFPKSSFSLYNKNGKQNLTDMNSKWNGNDRFTGEKTSFEHCLLHPNLIMNQEKQSEEFMFLSEQIFGNMFSVLSNL